jgi:excisionase family DNA binding protein
MVDLVGHQTTRRGDRMSQIAIEDDGPLLLSIKRVAPLLGLSEWQVRNLCVAGRLPSTRVGNRLYIPSAAVAEYIAQIGNPA